MSKVKELIESENSTEEVIDSLSGKLREARDYSRVEFIGNDRYNSIKDIQSDLQKRFEDYLFKGFQLTDDKYGIRIRRGFLNSVYPISKDGNKMARPVDALVRDYGWDMYLSLPGSNKIMTLEEMSELKRNGSTNNKLDLLENIINAIRNPSGIEFYYTKRDKLKA